MICSHSLGCESPKPLPPTASPRRRLALTEVGSQSSRACATAPGFGGRWDLRSGLAGEGGERAPFAVSLWSPQVIPTSFFLPPPAHRRPLPRNSLASRSQDPHSSLRSNDNSWIERWLVAPVAPLESGRDGQRRGGARSGGAGVRTNAGRLAPSPPPSPAGCREGAQRQRGLPGSPQRCDGVSAARARGEGPSALIRQGRALASDNHPPEPGPRG